MASGVKLNGILMAASDRIDEHTLSGLSFAQVLDAALEVFVESGFRVYHPSELAALSGFHDTEVAALLECAGQGGILDGTFLFPNRDEIKSVGKSAAALHRALLTIMTIGPKFAVPAGSLVSGKPVFGRRRNAVVSAAAFAARGFRVHLQDNGRTTIFFDRTLDPNDPRTHRVASMQQTVEFILNMVMLDPFYFWPLVDALEIRRPKVVDSDQTTETALTRPTLAGISKAFDEQQKELDKLRARVIELETEMTLLKLSIPGEPT